MTQFSKEEILNFIYKNINLVGEDLGNVAFINGNSYGFTVALFEMDESVRDDMFERFTLSVIDETDLNSILDLISNFYEVKTTLRCDETVNPKRPSHYDKDNVDKYEEYGDFLESVIITKSKNSDTSWVQYFIEPGEIEASYHNSLETCLDHILIFHTGGIC